MGHTSDNRELAKELAGTILTTKLVGIQTEYMGTLKTKITLPGVPMDISEDPLGGSPNTDSLVISLLLQASQAWQLKIWCSR